MAQASYFSSMEKELFITFNEPWFPKEDTVEGLLKRLDMGEQISLSELKNACEKERIEFKIVFDEYKN